MIKRFVITFFCTSLAFSCQGMMIIQLTSSFPGSHAYIPVNDADYELISYWLHNYTVYQIHLLDQYGVSAAGYILADNVETELPSINCASQDSTGQLFYPTSESGADGSVIASPVLPVPQAPVKFLEPLMNSGATSAMNVLSMGNPDSTTVCIDSILGRCNRSHCNYRHLSEQQKRAVKGERKIGKRECQICTNQYPHNIILCPFCIYLITRELFKVIRVI